jgi:hypothetical protein
MVREWKLIVSYLDERGVFEVLVYSRAVRSGERGDWHFETAITVPSLQGRLDPRERFRMILRTLG